MRFIARLSAAAGCLLVLGVFLSTALHADDSLTSDSSQKSASFALQTRVYSLTHIKTAEFEAMIRPLVSKCGEIDVLEGDRNMVVVCESEQVLNKIDQVAAKIDVPPSEVLIEAIIVRARYDKSQVAANASSIVAQALGSKADPLSRRIPLSEASAEDGAVDQSAQNLMEIAFVEDADKFIRTIAGLADVRVLALPRFRVLNKQRAEMHLCKHATEPAAEKQQTDPSQTENVPGTCLRLRPFIAENDNHIRLEIRLTDTDASEDGEQVHSTQITTNLLLSNGETVVISGFPDRSAAEVKESSGDSSTKSELLLILSPKRIQPNRLADAKPLTSL